MYFIHIIIHNEASYYVTKFLLHVDGKIVIFSPHYRLKEISHLKLSF